MSAFCLRAARRAPLGQKACREQSRVQGAQCLARQRQTERQVALFAYQRSPWLEAILLAGESSPSLARDRSLGFEAIL